MTVLDSGVLTLESVEKILFQNQEISIANLVWERVDECYQFLNHFSKGKVIYGINTGFGPMAPHLIEDANQISLQYNLIRSHCSGAGKMLSPLYVKAAMTARLNSLAQGVSGIHQSALSILKEMINRDITPVIYEHGGVGASGDLVQLAHLALVMIGEGEVMVHGELKPTKEVFSGLGISPMEVKLREGLAVMNGTSVMTGIGMVNTLRAKRAIEWSVMASGMITQILESYDDYFSLELNRVKKHPGQQKIASLIYEELNNSKLGRKREKELYNEKSEFVLQDKVQEYYSIRCVPQVTGAIFDALEQCGSLLEAELNSANDNPIIDPNAKNVFHGGNFHGDYVAYEMDKLRIGIAKLSILSERQINFLMNPKLNGILPPFVNLGIIGYNFGMQGIQFTATSNTAENQMLSNPMSIHSIPNNNDNQDIVSMGTNSALMTKAVIDNTFEVLAIEMLSIVQAIEYMKIRDKISPKAGKAFELVREIIPAFEEDFTQSKNLSLLKEKMLDFSPISIN